MALDMIPPTARDHLAACIQRAAHARQALSDARAAHALALEDDAKAKADLERVEQAERDHGQSLAAALRDAAKGGKRAPQTPAPDALERATATSAANASGAALEALEGDLRDAERELAQAEADLHLAAKRVLADEGTKLVSESQAALDVIWRNREQLQALVSAMQITIGEQGFLKPPPGSAQIIKADFSPPQKAPQDIAAVADAWRIFREQLETDPTAIAPTGLRILRRRS